MENKENLGFITTPSGKLEIIKALQFDETEKRKITICLSEENTIMIELDSDIHGPDNKVIQYMHLTKESFALIFLGMIEANKHFEINAEEILNKILPEKNLHYLVYPSQNDNEQ